MDFSIVIPTIGKNNMINNLVDQILRVNNGNLKKIYILNNGASKDVIDQLCDKAFVEIVDCLSSGIYQMWNIGVKKCLTDDNNQSICIFNDDIIIHENDKWFDYLFSPFVEEENWATCANYSNLVRQEAYIEVSGTFKSGGFGGFCFAINPVAYQSGLDFFDENYNWWYGDDDFVHSIQKVNKKVTLSIRAKIDHINGGSQTVVQYTDSFNKKVAKDRVYYLDKWHARS